MNLTLFSNATYMKHPTRRSTLHNQFIDQSSSVTTPARIEASYLATDVSHDIGATESVCTGVLYTV